MSKAFGTQFVVINDIVQLLDPKVFGGGPWMHLATVRRGLKEYMAFAKAETPADASVLKGPTEVWVEEIDPYTVALNKIEDDNEWLDVVSFLKEAKLLEFGNRRETLVDRKLVGKNKK